MQESGQRVVGFTFADFMASFVIMAIFAREMGGLKPRMDFNCGHTHGWNKH